jgi:hypothetical protein
VKSKISSIQLKLTLNIFCVVLISPAALNTV